MPTSDQSSSRTNQSGVSISSHDLSSSGLRHLKHEFWNLPTASLYEEAIRRGQGKLVHLGPLLVKTGKHTGRAANDKFIVEEPGSKDKIDWGKINRRMDYDSFTWLHKKTIAYFQNREAYVMDVWAGADERYRMPVRIVTESATHALFCRAMFLRPTDEELEDFEPAFTVLHAPGLHGNPESDNTNSETFIVVNFARNITLIGGTYYAGEIKKSVFSAMNYYLPQRGVLTMHASANIGTKGKSEGKTAIFFGLSGTGKTTLSADPERLLIGDDEHGWSDHGVFNIEGGCYAKVIRLNPRTEPEIFETTKRFGTVLENVGMSDAQRRLDLSDDSITENTRAAYPIHYIPNAKPDGMGGHASDIVMLTADAFGVLPPIAKLSKEQAMYWFLLGYTAKVAGTEMGVTEPTATFSACFGAPFMPLNPTVYAKMLGERIDEHGVRVWLLNTGWTGGPYGDGERMSLPHTRALLHAALDGALDDVTMRTDPHFGLEVPTTCAGVPDDILDPRATWKDKEAYDAKATALAALFVDGFSPYHDKVSDPVRNAGPKV
jgi:phosphoenolpyruvate carboxykinase (ATP)